MPQPPGHQWDRQRQRHQQVPCRKPEAEHGRREEARDEELRAERGGAQAGRQLDLANGGQDAREPVAVGPPQQPEPAEGEQDDRRPAQQPVLAVDEQRNEAVGALEIAAREGGVGRGLPGVVRGVGRGTPVEGLVQADVERGAEERHLHGADCQRPPPHTPQRARRQVADHEPGGEELRAEPREHPEQGEAAEGLPPARPRVEPQREQRGAGEGGPGGQLRVDRRGVGQDGRTEPHRQRRADRPRVRNHPPREPIRGRQGERGDRSEEQLDALGPGERIGRGDQQREAESERLVQLDGRLLAVLVELIGVEVVVGAGGVLVAHVDVAVFHERLGGEQVVGLITAVVGIAERVEPERGGVGAEEEEPQRGRASHGGVLPHRRGGRRAGHEGHSLGAVRSRPQQPSARAMTICCTSSVPSPIVRILASR